MGSGSKKKLSEELSNEEWSKAVKEAAAQVAEYAHEKAREKGAPFYFEDEQGRWVKEYPDGRRYEVIHGEGGKREIPLE